MWLAVSEKMEIAFLKYLFTKRNKSSIIILRVKNNFERYGRMISVKEATKNYINVEKEKQQCHLEECLY